MSGLNPSVQRSTQWEEGSACKIEDEIGTSSVTFNGQASTRWDLWFVAQIHAENYEIKGRVDGCRLVPLGFKFVSLNKAFNRRLSNSFRRIETLV